MLNRGAHVGRILRIHADERQVFLFRRPSMRARLGGLTKHDVLAQLLAILIGDAERLEIRIGLRFVACAEYAHMISILSGRNDPRRSRRAASQRCGSNDSEHPLRFAACHKNSSGCTPNDSAPVTEAFVM